MLSVGSNKALKFWRSAHIKREKGPLTGTSFEQMKSYFKLDGKIIRRARVLEIGIGFGHCIRGFKKAGCEVWAIDVCKEAFERVDNCLASYLYHQDANLLQEDYFDLVVCHLVTQHMSEEDILFQFPYVIRSLKDNGRFYVQFAYSQIEEENNIKETIIGEPGDNKATMLGGRMVRTEEYARKLIEKCGGEVVDVFGHRTFEQYKSGWYVLEVKKQIQ